MIRKIGMKGSVVTFESTQGIFIKDMGEKIVYIRIDGQREAIDVHLDKRNTTGIKGYYIDEKGEIKWDWRPEESKILSFSEEYRERAIVIERVEIQNGVIVIESRDGIFTKDFDDEIRELIIFEKEKVIVRLNTMSKENNRNIYCLNEKAEILWQIQDPDTYRPGKPQSDSPFTGIWISEDGRLKAYNWNSHDYDVDIETGRLLYAKWTK